MKEKLKAISIKLTELVQRIEALEIYQPSYELITKIQQVELKIDEIDDLLTWIEADQEF